MIAIATSVIIPCFNGLPHVLEAVRSVLEQANEFVQCTVVDDGSTDGSAQLLERTFGTRLRVVRQANAGVSVARNRGLAETTGELVMWLDADDVFTPGSLAARQQAFVDDPALELLVGVYRKKNFVNGTVEPTPRWASEERPLAACPPRPGDHPHVDILTFRRTAIEAIGGFDPRLATGEDFDLWIRAWALLRWRFTDAIQAWHRVGNHSRLTHRYGQLNTYRDVEVVLQKNRPLIRQVLGSDRPWRQTFTSWAADYALAHLNRGQRLAAAGRAWKAIRVGRELTEFRTFRFLLESLLPPPIYQWGARIAQRVSPARWHAQPQYNA